MPRRPRRWSDLSQVERVDVYTRQSMHGVLWSFSVTGVLLAVARSTSALEFATIVIGAVVVTGLASWVLISVMRMYPETSPLAWSRIATLLLAAVVYLGAVGLISKGPVRGAVVLIVVLSLSMAIGGLRDNRVAAGLILGSALLCGLISGEPRSAIAGAIFSAAMVFTARASFWLYRIVTDLDVARQAQPKLAVAEERLRFSRDVHDVLGRRLSTIAVQSELAATLAERGDDRAGARMLQVRDVAHEALTEARELARGYRPVDLDAELAGARSLLRSAGIGVQLDVQSVPRGWHEAAGWVVRESVTNVLRHSDAERVRISFEDNTLRVDNDGVTARSSAADGQSGSGLRGLRERLEPLGATLTGELVGAEWSLAAHLPRSGPLAATSGAARHVYVEKGTT